MDDPLRYPDCVRLPFSLSCFPLSCMHDLIWIVVDIVAYHSPSPLARLSIFQNPPPPLAATNTYGTARQATLSLLHPHSLLACIQFCFFKDINRSSPDLQTRIEHSLHLNVDDHLQKRLYRYHSRSIDPLLLPAPVCLCIPSPLLEQGKN